MNACIVQTLGHNYLVLANGCKFHLDRRILSNALSKTNVFADWDSNEKFDNVSLNRVVKAFPEDSEPKVIAKIADNGKIHWKCNMFESFVRGYSL